MRLRCAFGEADTDRATKSVSVEPPDAGDARRKRNPKGRLKKPTGCVAALARCAHIALRAPPAPVGFLSRRRPHRV
jgi:hypothetical protein